MPFIGEFAALATSICFSIGPIYFTLAGRVIGSIAVNRTRLVVALFYLSLVHWITLGEPLPFSAGTDRWFWLSISGLVGFVIGDAALFQAFLTIGTRLTMLVFSLSPIISAVLAWMFLDESLTSLQIIGMVITIAGIAWVVGEKNNQVQKDLSKKEYTWGLILGVIAAVGQAGGLVTAKLGLYNDYPVLSGQIIRMSAAAVIIWVMAFISRQAKETIEKVRAEPDALKQILIASFIGPFIGVYFSLVAIQFTSVGVASTLMALPPVFLIPISYFVFKEKVTWRSVLGTGIALVGVAMLFLV